MAVVVAQQFPASKSGRSEERVRKGSLETVAFAVWVEPPSIDRDRAPVGRAGLQTKLLLEAFA
jgi:hypothetical protein